MVRHWEYLAAEREGGDSSGEDGDGEHTAGRMIQDRDSGRRRAEEEHQRLTVKAAFFNTNNGMVASIDPGWLQLEFNTLTGLFDRVGLWTNFCKNVGMVCCPCRAAGVRAHKAYTRRMTREGRRFKERQRERLLCPECGKEMARGSLVTHR